MRTQKTIVSALALSLTIGAAQAQTEAGKLLISGQVNYAQSESESNTTNAGLPPTTIKQEAKQSGFNFAPQLGFFVADRLAVGVVGVTSTSKRTDNRTESFSGSSEFVNKYTYRNTTVSVGPFVRYYTMIMENLGFYGQLSGGYQRQTNKNSSDTRGQNGTQSYSYENKATGGYGNLTPGFVYFPTKKIGIELTLGNLVYSKLKNKQQNGQLQPGSSEGSSSDFGANFGLQNLAIGASFHLGN
ncbi:hypothetical protein J0X19_16040 [Hymenobacter sp. BT186]|uniref:Outer membrane protein beta-barrel domain-containing protein n=1 Tax=Hymenobacter telluris TaxID=2816474 RepID=A0A939EX54_9BACT|nr:hypothetical protein [Hymenobacter telluris]MBO0359474.1 hypothetical protein [Hymenobacter telluris]MBW3375500.1 hypothetical protein [Hymenobacter norwichensis]